MRSGSSIWRRFSRNTLGRYFIGLVATAVAVLLRELVDPVLGSHAHYVTLYPTIVLLVMYLGLGPSIVSVVLGVLAVMYWLDPIHGSFLVNIPANLSGALSFLVASACIIAAGEASRRSQTRLRRAKTLFEAFLDNSPGIEYLKDEAGKYLYVNRSGHALFPLDFVGKTDFDLFPSSVATQWRANDLRALDQNKAIEFVETTPDPHGERTWLSLKFPIIDTEGRRLLGGKSIDITEIKHAEKEIAALQRERAEQSAAELEDMVRLHEVGMRCVRTGNDVKGSLNAILEAAIFLTRAAKGNLQLLDPSSGALKLVAQHGFVDPFLRFFSSVAYQPSTCGAALGERVVVEDVVENRILGGTPSLSVLLAAGVRAVQSTPLVSSSGKLLGMISTHYAAPHRPRERELRLMDLLAQQAADYLERKQGEDELRISEERLRLAQMSGNVGVWDWDVKGKHVRWTPELEAMFGLTPGAVRTYGDFSTRVHPDDLEMVERRRDEALRRHEPFDLEFRIIHASGNTRWVVAKGRGFYDNSGQLIRVLGNNIDITERKQVEEEMRAASELLRRFLDAAPTGLTRCSRDLRYLMANPSFARMMGLPVDQIVGRPIVDVMGAEAWEGIRPYVERVLRGEPVEYEMARPFPSGTSYVHVAYTPEKDGHEVVGWVASVTDITEFKRVEKKLHGMEKMAAAGQLAATLAHEINNPLSAVINVLYLLGGRSDLDPVSTSWILIANNEIARLARIVRQSLSYYRVGMTATEVDLAALVEESLQVFSDKFQRTSIATSKKITPGTNIIGFADEIRQVVDNLLINSLEATLPGGRLLLCLRQTCNWKNRSELGVRLTIADNGCGIPQANLSRVFEPFFTTKAEKGTGLGLWVVRGIVEKHGGSIKVRSTDVAARSGTVISIFWPSAVKARPPSSREQSEHAA